MNAEEIINLSQESIIKIAIDKLNQRFTKAEIIDFDPANFDRVKVMVAADSVSISFGMAYRYVPINSAFYYGIYINLTENVISYKPLSNPQDQDHSRKPKFFRHTEGF